MEVSFSRQFIRLYKKGVGNGSISDTAFRRALSWFTEDPFDARLKTHKLSGKLKGLWSYTIEYDLRVVFYFTKDKPPKAIFTDIGTHDEVY